MKRILCTILIALLVLCPLLASTADDAGYIVVPDDVLSAEEDASLEARAEELWEAYHVAVYFLYTDADNGGSALIEQAQQFVKDRTEAGANVLLLAVNPSLYYFSRKGSAAEAAFPESVCDAVLWEAFRSVKGDNAGKIRAYLDAADELLINMPEATPEPDGSDGTTAGGNPTIVDKMQLLTDEEKATLSRKYAEIGNRYQCDVVALITDGFNGQDGVDYTYDYFDYNGYGYGAKRNELGMTVDGDGILLMFAPNEREFCVCTSGAAIEIFPDDRQDELDAYFLPYLNSGDYYQALDGFADGCEVFLSRGPAATPEPEPTPVPTPMPPVTYLKSGKLPVVDSAGLLSADAVTALSEKLVAISDRYQCDIVIVTVDGIGKKTATAFADDFFDYNGYGYNAVPDENGVTINGDGILLLVSMEERDYAISTSGFGIKALTDYGISDLEDRFLPDLSRGDYAASFNTFADRCEWLLKTARNGKPYDVGYYVNWFTFAVAIVVGFLFAFIPVSAMKGKLKSVAQNREANRYLDLQSFQLTQNTDVFLNSSVTRVKHVEPQKSSGGGGHFGGSSTHTSSSGGTHGGHSGKF